MHIHKVSLKDVIFLATQSCGSQKQKNLVLILHINLFVWRSHMKIYLLKLHTRSVDLLVCFLVVHTPKSRSRLGFSPASMESYNLDPSICGVEHRLAIYTMLYNIITTKGTKATTGFKLTT
jgi:hypothetical protein